jgi:hypothetical protein
MAAYIRLASKQTEINRELVERQHEIVQSAHPARIVYNGKAMFPIIWEAEHGGRTVLASPVPYTHYVKDHSHLAFNHNFGSFFNKLTYWLADFGLIVTAMMSARWLGLKKVVTFQGMRQVLAGRKVVYTISPSLFPRPEYWSENIKVLGYHERKLNINWRPDRALSDFVEKHETVLLITFGSMTNPDPEGKTKAFLEALQRNRICAIVNTAAGGLVKPDRFDSNLLCFTSEIPYDWILPKVYGAIHHGGSGTTHKALKYGCATMIVPHILDQFVWNEIVAGIGAGPRGMGIGKITPDNLEPKMVELLATASFKSRATEVARRMREEDFREELHEAIVG